jgi:tRNA-Thr(GGU) m(6)t(6)A37 methyltransferase TsaA
VSAPRKLVRAIGVLESCFKEKFGAPRQPGLVPHSRAKLKIKAEFIPEQSLKGLAEFSHVWLLSYFNLNTNKIFLSTVHPPRLKGKTVGVFASRSPHRPSPIGLSAARLLRVEGDTLHLAEIDLVDGTPILDVKPYIPGYDRVESATEGWTNVADELFEVVFSPAAETEVHRRLAMGQTGLRDLIKEVLKRDLRNPRDRSQMKEGKDLGFFLYDCDVHFEVRGKTATVTRITPAHESKTKRKPPIVPDEL